MIHLKKYRTKEKQNSGLITPFGFFLVRYFFKYIMLIFFYGTYIMTEQDVVYIMLRNGTYVKIGNIKSDQIFYLTNIIEVDNLNRMIFDYIKKSITQKKKPEDEKQTFILNDIQFTILGNILHRGCIIYLCSQHSSRGIRYLAYGINHKFHQAQNFGASLNSVSKETIIHRITEKVLSYEQKNNKLVRLKLLFENMIKNISDLQKYEENYLIDDNGKEYLIQSDEKKYLTFITHLLKKKLDKVNILINELEQNFKNKKIEITNLFGI